MFQIKAFNYRIMLDFIKNLLADERGSISHKRSLSIIGSFILFGVYCFTKEQHLADLIFYLVCAWCGLATVDKFSNK